MPKRTVLTRSNGVTKTIARPSRLIRPPRSNVLSETTIGPHKTEAAGRGSPSHHDTDRIDGLKAIHAELGRLRKYTANMIAAAEKPQPESIVTAASAVLDMVPVPEGTAVDVWHVDAAAPDTVRRWAVCKEALIVDTDKVVASVMVAGVQSATVAPAEDGDGWRVVDVELGHWALQVVVDHVLSADRASELATALADAADFLRLLEPEPLVPPDELARRRARK